MFKEISVDGQKDTITSVDKIALKNHGVFIIKANVAVHLSNKKVMIPHSRDQCIGLSKKTIAKC